MIARQDYEREAGEVRTRQLIVERPALELQLRWTLSGEMPVLLNYLQRGFTLLQWRPIRRAGAHEPVGENATSKS